MYQCINCVRYSGLSFNHRQSSSKIWRTFCTKSFVCDATQVVIVVDGLQTFLKSPMLLQNLNIFYRHIMMGFPKHFDPFDSSLSSFTLNLSARPCSKIWSIFFSTRVQQMLLRGPSSCLNSSPQETSIGLVSKSRSPTNFSDRNSASLASVINYKKSFRELSG